MSLTATPVNTSNILLSHITVEVCRALEYANATVTAVNQ